MRKKINLKKYYPIKSSLLKIKINHQPSHYDLQWTGQERRELESRIIHLRNDQIGALLNLVGLGFEKEDIEYIVREIKKHKHESGHLSILTDEADSKKNLLWWINYFEKENSSTSRE